jgi:hypothetical protein
MSYRIFRARRLRDLERNAESQIEIVVAAASPRANCQNKEKRSLTVRINVSDSLLAGRSHRPNHQWIDADALRYTGLIFRACLYRTEFSPKMPK